MSGGVNNIGNWGLMLQADYYHGVMNNRDVDDNWIASQTTAKR